jgi:hypothetical protein
LAGAGEWIAVCFDFGLAIHKGMARVVGVAIAPSAFSIAVATRALVLVEIELEYIYLGL